MDNNNQPNLDHDLDADSKEYFQFKLQGNIYKVRYMTMGEVETLKKAGETDKKSVEDGEEQKKSQEFLFSFIEPVDPKAPSIVEAYNKMNSRIAKKFFDMIVSEFAG